ncbi:hypothetical protein AB5I41_13710 [Sphingomonas sp. MMS24-JH45]
MIEEGGITERGERLVAAEARSPARRRARHRGGEPAWSPQSSPQRRLGPWLVDVPP